MKNKKKTKTKAKTDRPHRSVQNKNRKREFNREDKISNLPEEKTKTKTKTVRPQQSVRNKNGKREYKREDRISNLPEEILVRIVSFLPLKDATVTSMLSRRWRKIWTFTSNLNFDGDETLMHMMISSSYYSELKSQRHKFMQWVNSVTSKHKGDIDRFRIYFDLNLSCTSSIDSWIKLAMEKRVQILELELLEEGAQRMLTYCYNLTQQLVSSLGFNKSLKVLHLESVDVTGEVLETLLSKCPLLERLKIHGSPSLTYLRVAGPSLSLKYLDLYYCHEIKSIEICDAENLASLYLRCSEQTPMKLLIRNVPMLVDVIICLRENTDYLPRAFTLLSCCVSHLQILELDIYLHHVENDEYPVPMLTNLKQLKLILSRSDNFNLFRIIPFIKASPYLQRLVVKLFVCDDGSGEFMIPTKCAHKYLKEVEIFGYSGLESDVDLITYLIENAVSLEKIIINPSQYRQSNWRRPKRIKTIEEEKMAKDHAMKHMKEKVPSSVKFICL